MIRPNILLRELAFARRSLIIWSLVILITVIVYLGFFPYMQDPDLVRAMESYPDSIKSAFNMSVTMFTDVNIYHGGLVMSYVLLLASIYAMMLAGSLITRDSDLGTAEFLYTRPVTRTRVMLSKLAAFVIIMLLIWLVTFGVSCAVGLTVSRDEFNVEVQLLVHLAALLATLAAGGIAFAIAPRLNQLQSSTSIGAGLGLGFFLINSVSNMTERLEPLGYATIYRYAALERTAGGQPYTTGLIILGALFIVGSGLGLILLGRKEFDS